MGALHVLFASLGFMAASKEADRPRLPTSRRTHHQPGPLEAFSALWHYNQVPFVPFAYLPFVLFAYPFVKCHWDYNGVPFVPSTQLPVVFFKTTMRCLLCCWPSCLSCLWSLAFCALGPLAFRGHAYLPCALSILPLPSCMGPCLSACRSECHF